MSVAHTVAVLAGRYQLDQPIASGGFGEVWRGTDVLLARPIAIKLLHPELAADAETLARFRDSARHTGSLVHGNIARIYDYIERDSGHSPFFVMEFVDGPSLAEVVAGGPLEPRRVIDVVAQVADALDAAHQAGLIHGDIKPANVLLSPDGVVKLTDFGIAAGPGPASVTDAGALVGGDPDYFVREPVKGANGTAAGDLYSLGVMAYQCLTGGRSASEGAAGVALVRRRDPSLALPAGAPAEVAALIGQLTARDPASRASDAGEVARRAGELRNCMIADDTGQPGGVSAAPPVAQASQQASEAPIVQWRGDNRKRRGRRILLAAAAVGTAVTAVLLSSVIGPQHDTH